MTERRRQPETKEKVASTQGPPRVAVIVPAYNGGELLEECLASIASSELRVDTVVLVDNASADGSVDSATQRFPTLHVIRNPENRGFGAACNQGIAVASARGCEFVFLLNQDARIEPTTLGWLVAFMRERPRTGVVGAKTLSPARAADGAPILLYNGAWRRVLPLWQRIPGIGRSSRNAPETPREVDYVWGHGMLLRGAAVREVGGFDPAFFMYYEDLDLCRRLRQVGWEIWCESRAVMWHAIDDGPRAKESEGWRWQLKVESARHFHRRHYGQPLADVLWCVSTVREAIPLLLEGHSRALTHLLRAWWRVLRGARVRA